MFGKFLGLLKKVLESYSRLLVLAINSCAVLESYNFCNYSNPVEALIFSGFFFPIA